MRQITMTKALNLSAKTAWASLSDFMNVHHFHPSVAEVTNLTPGTNTGLGATRRCHFHDGKSIDEKITAIEAGTSLEIELFNAPMPLRDLKAVLSVKDLSGGRSEVTVAMDYRPKFGPIGALMNAMMIRRLLTKSLGDMLDGLEYHGQTGQRVGTFVPKGQDRLQAA